VSAQPDDHHDDLVVVPKGRSKLAFFFTLGIMLFVLFIFTVGDDVTRTLSGEQAQGSQTYMSWTSPTRGTQQLSEMDFVLEKRALAPLRGNDVQDDDVAYWIVIDALAQESGIAVTDEELSEFILATFQSAAGYQQWVRSRRGLTAKSFEGTVRRELRVRRYLGLIASAARPFDPSEIEDRWKSRHQEYRFEYIAQPVADMLDAARADVADDTELEAYYDGMYDYLKQEYELAAEVRAEVVTLSLEGDPAELGTRAQKLLEAYPGPDADPAERAREYYDGFAYARFRKENPDISKIDPSQGIRPEFFQKPFEDVEELALAEAPLYDAFVAWNAELVERLGAGEAIDLAQEAAALGLDYLISDERMSLDVWKAEHPELSRAADQLAQFTEVGSVTPAPVVGSSSLVIGRVLDKVEKRQPEFSEIRDQIAETWIEEHAVELAMEKLDALRDEFGERPEEPLPFRPEVTSERMAEVAQAAGYELKVREWKDRMDRPEGDLSSEDQFFLSHTKLYQLREDGVADPSHDNDKAFVYLARVAGIRDPEVSGLDPAEIQGLQQTVEQETITAFSTRTFNSRGFMQERYGLWLESWSEEEPETPR
jgi:hypothetical protein